jgi:hypothetical protein
MRLVAWNVDTTWRSFYSEPVVSADVPPSSGHSIPGLGPALPEWQTNDRLSRSVSDAD